MEMTDSKTYDAPVHAVLEMLRDPEATVAKYQCQGHRDVTVEECAEAAGVLRIRTSRVVDVELPGFAKRVLKPTNTMHQIDEWKKAEGDRWEGTFDVKIDGAPVHISGTMSLEPDGTGSRHSVTATVTASIPVIGGRIAQWAGNNDVRRSIEAEYAFNSQWLAEHPAPGAPRSSRGGRRAS